MRFQSTRPIRGATHNLTSYGQAFCIISIHAPHTGRDRFLIKDFIASTISIHAPHTGRDPGISAPPVNRAIFQSTRPIRGATLYSWPLPPPGQHFNPRAPYGARQNGGNNRLELSTFQSTRPIRGATHKALVGHQVTADISIHAPHTGRDGFDAPDITPANDISIHAPHTGRDFQAGPIPYPASDFNPRAPYGARLVHLSSHNLPPQFQSTRPIRGATQACPANLLTAQFQSTRPIRGATMASPSRLPPVRYFNPRAPYGARRQANTKTLRTERFQSTRPIRGATDLRTTSARTASGFQSTRPIRGATILHVLNFAPQIISIHAPHTGRDVQCTNGLNP